MKNIVVGTVLVVLVLAVSGCNPSYEQAEIDVSSDVKKAIESITPRRAYGYYALKTAHPEKAEDLTGMTMLICGDVGGSNIGFEVAASSITSTGTFLFRSSTRYFVNENVGCEGSEPCATMFNNFSAEIEGVEAEFISATNVYGNHVSDKTLLAKCIEEMRQHPATVLLVKKRAIEWPVEVVEIAFK